MQIACTARVREKKHCNSVQAENFMLKNSLMGQITYNLYSINNSDYKHCSIWFIFEYCKYTQF